MSIVKGYVQTDLGQIHYRKRARDCRSFASTRQRVPRDVRGLYGSSSLAQTPSLPWIRLALGFLRSN